MKIKIDENLPLSIAILFSQKGHDADTIPQEGLKGAPDGLVWEETQRTGRLLITQDLDFSDVNRYRPGKHFGILLLRLRDPGRKALRERVESILEREKIESWGGCFVVATDRKIRIRRPIS